MSMKILAGFAAALVVTTVGVFAANGGSVSSLFDSDSGPSPCSKQSGCPLSGMISTSVCADDTADATLAPASEEALGACAGGTMSAASTPVKSPCCEKSTAKKTCCSDE